MVRFFFLILSFEQSYHCRHKCRQYCCRTERRSQGVVLVRLLSSLAPCDFLLPLVSRQRLYFFRPVLVSSRALVLQQDFTQRSKRAKPRRCFYGTSGRTTIVLLLRRSVQGSDRYCASALISATSCSKTAGDRESKTDLRFPLRGTEDHFTSLITTQLPM